MKELVQTCVKKVTDILQSQLKEIVQDAINIIRYDFNEDVDAIRAELMEIKSSQEFISAKFDQLDQG